MSYQKHDFTPGAILLASELNDMDNQIEVLSNQEDSFSEAFKTALLNCFENVAWINENGQLYYDALYDSLYPNDTWLITNILTGCTTSNNNTSISKNHSYVATISANQGYTLDSAIVSITMGGNDVTNLFYSSGSINIPNVTGDLVISVTATSSVASISVVFTQGQHEFYSTDSLETLRPYLVVTATLSNSSTIVTNDYTLSGTLTQGTSTVTASYGGKSGTFTVTNVVGAVVPSEYRRIEYITRPASATTTNTYNSTYVTPNGTDDLEVRIGFTATATPSGSSGGYVLAERQTSSNNTVGFGVYVQTSLENVGAFAGESALLPPKEGNSILNQRYDVTSVRTTTSLSINDGDNSQSITLSPRNMNGGLHIFGLKTYTSGAGIVNPFTGSVFYVIVIEGGVRKANLLPCIRVSDNAIGWYDTVQLAFRTASGYIAGPVID